MKQTLTIETEEAAVIQLLRSMAETRLLRLLPEASSRDDLLLSRLNEIYEKDDSSLDPGFALAQVEAMDNEPLTGEGW